METRSVNKQRNFVATRQRPAVRLLPGIVVLAFLLGGSVVALGELGTVNVDPYPPGTVNRDPYGGNKDAHAGYQHNYYLDRKSRDERIRAAREAWEEACRRVQEAYRPGISPGTFRTLLRERAEAFQHLLDAEREPLIESPTDAITVKPQPSQDPDRFLGSPKAFRTSPGDKDPISAVEKLHQAPGVPGAGPSSRKMGTTDVRPGQASPRPLAPSMPPQAPNWPGPSPSDPCAPCQPCIRPGNPDSVPYSPPREDPGEEFRRELGEHGTSIFLEQEPLP
jgi:hypothetical protein